ncbi:hypothetical protein [Hyphomicrobium sp.]|uniref:hypothetical protein n=1 Tax=Hyphomicrobium sp. TaxID=82 RepID=UPI001D72FB88|nr:hypothetical protein [Hyphomicrobium sp.]MBY0559898.1 hypothetical protein [Hyphomicrobium sp.]
MKIVAAALKSQGLILSMPAPARHSDIISAMHFGGTSPLEIAGCIQGFLTDKGTFVDRERAALIAFEAEQFMPRRLPCELYSEDLW